MREIIFCLVLLSGSYCSAQTYSYGFSGSVDQKLKSELENSCSTLTDVRWCKLRYKEAEQMGELIIMVEENQIEGSEGRTTFSPIDVKALLMRMGLNPLEFRQIEK